MSDGRFVGDELGILDGAMDGSRLGGIGYGALLGTADGESDGDRVSVGLGVEFINTCSSSSCLVSVVAPAVRAVLVGARVGAV